MRLKLYSKVDADGRRTSLASTYKSEISTYRGFNKWLSTTFKSLVLVYLPPFATLGLRFFLILPLYLSFMSMLVRTTAAGAGAGASGLGSILVSGRRAFMPQTPACASRPHLPMATSLIPAMPCALNRHAQGPSDKFRHYSSNTSSTVSSASTSSPSSPSSTQSKSAFQYDQPFLDLVISRLSEQSDTSAYFKNCKDKALRQAGVFMVRGEQGTRKCQVCND